MGDCDFFMLTSNEKLNWLYAKVSELERKIDQQNASAIMDKIAILEAKIDKLLEG